jgi:SAM-dependent methyltransferase
VLLTNEFQNSSITLTPLDEHYQKMRPGKNKDFRTFSIAAKMVDIIGDEKGKILDIGCGFGILVAMGTQKGKDILGIDTSPHMIDGSQKYLESVNLSPNLVQLTTIEELIEQNMQYDVIIMIDVLEHIEDSKGFLKLVEELLSTKGRLILSVPAHSEFYDSRDIMLGHFRRYEEDTLLNELDATQLHLQDLYYWNFLGWLERKFRQRFLSNIKTNKQYAFRYSNNIFSRLLNQLLRGYVLLVENHIRPFCGLTLILVASKE